jgi:arsenite-transporting ATPase
VIKEAQRAFTYLSLYGYVIDAVVVNRVLPDTITDSYFDRWREVQHAYQGTVEEAFSPVPVLRVPLFDREVVGVEMLGRMGDEVFAGVDAAGILYSDRGQVVERDGSEYVMRLRLPFVHRDEVELSQSQGDLLIKVGPYRREVALPRALRGRSTVGAKLEDGELSVRFS